MRVEFGAPYNDEWAPVVSQPIMLQQGESQDIGKLKPSPAIAVQVRVVGPRGEPLEGVAVRRMHDRDGAWCVAHNTDANGVAHFFIDPHTTSQIRVFNVGPHEEAMKAQNLAVKFDVEDQPPKQVLQIRLTEKQVEQLKSGAQ